MTCSGSDPPIISISGLDGAAPPSSGPPNAAAMIAAKSTIRITLSSAPARNSGSPAR